MTEIRSGKKWHEYVDMKISAGSLLVLLVQIAGAIAYVMINLSTIKDLKTAVEDVQKSQFAMSIAMPVQNVTIQNMQSGIKDLHDSMNIVANAVATLKESYVGLRSDVNQLQDNYHDLTRSSAPDLRKLR